MPEHDRERLKILMRNFSDEIETKASKFLINNLNKEENTNDVLDLILSSHITSIINLMRYFSEEHPHIKEKVNFFIKDLIEFLAGGFKLEVERIKKDKKDE